MRHTRVETSTAPRQFSALVAAGVAGAIIALSTLLFVDLRTRSQDSLAQRDERAWSTLVDSLEEAVDAYVDALFASKAYFATVGEPGPEEFVDFATSLDLVERRPGFQVYGRASWVATGDLIDYVRWRRRLLDRADMGPMTFDVHPAISPGADGALVIDSVFPFEGNEVAVGLDFLGEGNRERAALTTRDTGTAIATGPITLVQETGDQRAFLVMLAQYADGLPTGTVSERRAAFSGVSYAGFRMGDLMESVIGGANLGDVTIYDVGAEGDEPVGLTSERLTFTNDRSARAGVHDEVRSDTIEILGRQWWIGLESESASGVEQWAPWGVLAGGIVIGLLTGLLVERLYSSKRRAVALATRMTEELRQREVELERSNDELERFAYIASHDLQEPLRTVTNYIGLVELSSGDTLTDETRRHLSFAATGAERMSRLVSELLEFSQTGRGRSEGVVDLADVWSEVATNLDSAIQEAAAVLRADELPSVTGDRRELVQVFQNLVANSIKYRGPDPLEVVCTAERHGDRVRIRLRDNGIGVPVEYHETVFGMFKRLHTREQYEGTGMGLAIVRRIVEACGGQITIEATAGPGTTFLIELPAASETSPSPGSRPVDDRVLIG